MFEFMLLFLTASIATVVSAPSFTCSGQHLDPAGIKIPFSISRVKGAFHGATTNLTFPYKACRMTSSY